MLALLDDFLVGQSQLDVLSGKAKSRCHFFLQFPDSRRGVDFKNESAVKLEATIVALLVLDHVAHNDTVQHLTLEHCVMGMHTTSTLLFTDLDHNLKHLGKSLNDGWVTLIFSDELEATSVQALQHFAAAGL